MVSRFMRESGRAKKGPTRIRHSDEPNGSVRTGVILGENGRGPLWGRNQTMSAIQLEGIAKHWGESRALDGITFAADPGSFVVLLGPSGCGKSTTLRLIAGLDTPTAGAIRIGGRDVTRVAPAARGISLGFQSYAL